MPANTAGGIAIARSGNRTRVLIRPGKCSGSDSVAIVIILVVFFAVAVTAELISGKAIGAGYPRRLALRRDDPVVYWMRVAGHVFFLVASLWAGWVLKP